MTGKEFKKFVSDRELSTHEAVKMFGITRTTLFRQYRRAEVNRTIAIVCKLEDKYNSTK